MKHLFNEALTQIKEKKWIFSLLFVAILIALLLRAYNFDSPVVGYHNWKETHYLTEARNFANDGFFKYGFFVPALDYPQLSSDPTGAHADTFPFISIVVAVFFKIFGQHITVARAVDLLFGILIIPAMFLFVHRLFKRDDIAVVAAFITAFNPMLIFFTHNTQLQNPGLLFMLLGGYFYMRWHENDLDLDLILASLFVTLSALNVFTFLMILLPIGLTFPFERIKKFTVSRLKTYVISGAIMSAVALWILYMKFIVMPRTGLSTFGAGLVNLAPLYMPQFWGTIKNYAADNYTMLGVVLAFIGIIAISANFFREKNMFGKEIAIPFIIASIIVIPIIAWKAEFRFAYAFLFAVLAFFALPIFKRESTEGQNTGFLAHKFMILYGIGAAIFFMVMAEKLGGHSYHQYPILPFLVIAGSFAIISVSENIAAFVSGKMPLTDSEGSMKKADVFKIFKYLLVIVLILGLVYGMPHGSGTLARDALGSSMAVSGSLDAKNRQFDVTFPGIDIAGDYVKANAGKDDRVLISGGEIMGLLWHADRKGYYGISDVATIKQAEQKGVKWVFVYSSLGRNELGNNDVLEYIKTNYELKQLGFVAGEKNSLSIVYFLFKKGGTFDPAGLNNITRDYPVNTKLYRLSGDKAISFGYITLDKKTTP